MHIRHFGLLENETKKLKMEFQLYAVFLDKDSYSDALFLNTQNPNHDRFPWKYEDLSNKSTITNIELDNYIKELNGFEKLYSKAEESFCVLI